MTKWRPEGWETIHLPQDDDWHDNYAAGYEDGTDAMLDALRKEGVHFEVGEWTDDATFKTDEPCTIVTIPDTEDSK